MLGFGKAAADRSSLNGDASVARAAPDGRAFSSMSATASMTNMVCHRLFICTADVLIITRVFTDELRT